MLDFCTASTEPLPDLMINAYYLLGMEWRANSRDAYDWSYSRVDLILAKIFVADFAQTTSRYGHIRPPQCGQVEGILSPALSCSSKE